MSDPITWAKDDKYEKHLAERGEWGFSTVDWWNFFQYHSWVMVNVLEKFKREAHGHPVYGEVETMDDWVRVLTEIQDGFKAHIQIEEELPIGEEYERLRAIFDRGMDLLKIYYGSLWD